jgi:3,4-dihydroxy 2-butanone 4-phosphate synthase/GTP cyclohydrolase II
MKKTLIDSFRTSFISVLVDDHVMPHKTSLVAPAQLLDQVILNRLLLLSASQVYVTLTSEKVRQFDLQPMLRNPLSQDATASTRMLSSVEAREGIHTGISIADRFRTIQVLAESQASSRNLVKPGHVFPVEVSDGGVLFRAERMEAAADLCDLVFKSKVAVVVDLLNANGDYFCTEELEDFSSINHLAVFKLSEIIMERLQQTPLIERVSEANIPLNSGTIFKMIAYKSKLDSAEHVALTLGEPFDDQVTLTRVQKENLFEDLFNSHFSEKKSSLKKSIDLIEENKSGLLVYLRASQKNAFNSLCQQSDRSSMFRDYGIGAQIVKDCGASQLSLLSSSQVIPEGLEGFGLKIHNIIKI